MDSKNKNKTTEEIAEIEARKRRNSRNYYRDFSRPEKPSFPNLPSSGTFDHAVNIVLLRDGSIWLAGQMF